MERGTATRCILVTGATGFIGPVLVVRLAGEHRWHVRAAVWGPSREWPAGVEPIIVGDLGALGDWQAVVSGVDTVVHLAARVHVMRDTSGDPLAEYRRVNVAGTANLARQAVAAGVRRFVFLSSVKVHGERGAFDESDSPCPTDPYAISKHEAEQSLRQIAAGTRMEAVIIRAPLVYGPGVRANFRSLMRAVARGVPLPLGAVTNRRSLVGVDNLVDLIVTCIEHPAAANDTFLVSDGEDLSTAELIRRMGKFMGRPARLFPVPKSILLLGAAVVGRRDVAERLVGSLQVDISKARARLGWTPPLSVDEGLRRTVTSPR
jgi:UDP-glucose 4-epimerase